MKVSHFIFILFFVTVGTAVFAHFQSIHQAQNRIGSLYSDDKSKSISFNCSTDDTQLILNFHSHSIGGSGLFHIATDSTFVDIIWLDDDHLQVSYPRGVKVYSKKDTIKFFNQYAFVKYLEK